MKGEGVFTFHIDIWYSPDDGGWYFQNTKTGDVSKRVYDTRDEAVEAFNNGKVEWE